MSIKLIGLGDVHLRNKAFYRAGFKGFLDWFDKTIPDEHCESTEILLAGDFLNKISMLPRVGAESVRFTSILKRKASTVYCILGNHDYGTSGYKVINIKDFLEELGIVVIDDFCEYTTKLGFNILCLPWRYGCTHAQVNKYLKSLDLEHTEYDACSAHWELESMFGSDFVDLSPVNAKAFMCGHIHSHKCNPKYLGSILPNQIEEVKDNDPSVVRILVKDLKNNECKNHEFQIPNFISIKKVTINSLADIQNLQADSNCFYKVYHPTTLSEKDIKNRMKILNIQLYGFDEVDAEVNEDVKIEFGEIEEYKTQSHQDILNKLQEVLKLDNRVLTACNQAIQATTV